jgi:hypothetical protein
MNSLSIWPGFIVALIHQILAVLLECNPEPEEEAQSYPDVRIHDNLRILKAYLQTYPMVSRGLQCYYVQRPRPKMVLLSKTEEVPGIVLLHV